MKPEEIKDLRVDKMYLFYFKNGSVLKARGSAMLQIKNGVYVINAYKVKRLYKIEEV